MADPEPSIYWGALIDGNAYGVGDPPFDTRAIDIFETHAHKKLAILRWGQPWAWNGVFQPFQAAQNTKLRQRGIIPLIDWWAWDLCCGMQQAAFQSSAVTAGRYDSYIRQWARDAKAWGHPFFLRLNPEMNGWWYPWSEGRATANGPIVNGNAAGDYVKMWRHVHDLFIAENVTNVTWIWNINVMTTNSQYPALASLYPGDAYVDWTGLSVYNKNPQSLPFNQLMTGEGVPWLKNSYQDLVSLAPDKPVLADVGSWEYNNDPQIKANWIRETLLNQLPTNFPRVKAVLWFNWDDGDPQDTTPIESSQAAQAAFASAIASYHYATNTYANLETSPIPALPN
jgi:hypothetical protein